MDYYNYINQRQVSLDGRHSSAADFDGSSRFSLTGGRGGDERYFGTAGVLARCGASTFVGGQRHLGGVRLDGSAVANGELSPGRESAGYGRPFATSTNAGTSAAADALACGEAPRTSATANDRHAEPTASTSLHGHHQPQRLRYLPPPPGSVLPPLDVDDDDDDVASPAADGRSSAGSTQSSTSGSRHHPAAAATSPCTLR